MDIIDFRYRPPYGSYRETIMYRDLERARRCSEAFGMTQSPAVAARDMEASLTEMDRAGIGMAVLAGRKVLPHIGIVDNQDIVDLIHAYPGRFTGMAGVDPSDGPEAMEELERYVVGEGLRGIVMEPGLTKTPMFVEDERIFPLYERCQGLQLRPGHRVLQAGARRAGGQGVSQIEHHPLPRRLALGDGGHSRGVSL